MPDHGAWRFARRPPAAHPGEATALGSAIAYGFFSNGLAAHVRPQDMSAVWGYVGLLSIALGSVLMALGHLTGLEPIEVPSRKAVGVMLLNGFLGTSISDYVWARGLLLTSPLLATVTLNMSIPVSFFVDAVVLRQHAFSLTAPLGAFLVFLGVVAGGVEETMCLLGWRGECLERVLQVAQHFSGSV